MGPLTPVVTILVGVVGAVAASALVVLQRMRRVLLRPERPALPGPTPGVPAVKTSDLLDYPRRLQELEQQLDARLGAVQAQIGVLYARRQEVGAKAGRADLASRYDQDLGLLIQREGSMRRVLGLVWKTRAILLLRVHLAITARQRPPLRLPDPHDPSLDLSRATHAYHHAAGQVRIYLAHIEARAQEVERIVPAPAVGAELDEPMRAEVVDAQMGLRGEYRTLLEEMDRLADNLTWLGDHFATLSVMTTEARSPVMEGDPGRLLAQVGAALEDLSAMARTVDPVLVDDALDHLARDISRLEEAGREAEAEAEAHLEVERLLSAQTG